MSAEIKEQQEEEREALVSIYDGDKAFKEINPTTYQYKVNIFYSFTLKRESSIS